MRRYPIEFEAEGHTIKRRSVTITFEGSGVDPEAIIQAVRDAGLPIGCMKYELYNTRDWQEEIKSFLRRMNPPMTKEDLKRLLEGPKQVGFDFTSG